MTLKINCLIYGRVLENKHNHLFLEDHWLAEKAYILTYIKDLCALYEIEGMASLACSHVMNEALGAQKKSKFIVFL